MTSHLFIPDTQVKPEVPMDHLAALGNWIVEHKPDVIIHAGDHFDMPSLNTHEKAGSKYFHDMTYQRDVNSGIDGLNTLFFPLCQYNTRRIMSKKKVYNPRRVFLTGNHEYRIERTVKNLPILEGAISLEDLKLQEYFNEVYPYLAIADIDGIKYSHYFINPSSLIGATVTGTIDNKLKLLGFSFSMGHQQSLQWGRRDLSDGSTHLGLVAGSFYMHDEDYRNLQGNKTHWRGVVHKKNVKDGVYDPEFISLENLLRDYL